MVTSLDQGAALGLTVFGVWQVHEAYAKNAPSLRELRQDDGGGLQFLVDTDVTVGIVSLVAGTAASVLMRNPLPLLLIGLTFAATAGYYHSILNAPSVPNK